MVFYLKSNRIILGLALLLVSAFSCGESSEKKDITKKSEELIMYQPSEMAMLMKDFYRFNESLKAAIQNNEPLPEMPANFLDIHSATMTDANGRTQAFKNFAPSFIAAQQRVTDSLQQGDITTKYNNAISMCIACHKTECVGPIPKIKKLYIE